MISQFLSFFGLKQSPPSWWTTNPSVKVLGLHAIGSEKDSTTDPDLTISMEVLQELVLRALDSGHAFVSLEEVLLGDVPHDCPSILVTFDDAYAGIQPAVQWLLDHGVPTAIFACTHHCVSGHSFWWDVLRRERLKRNVAPEQIKFETKSIKPLTPQQIRDYLTTEFGSAVVDAVCEGSRAMNPQEIAALSKQTLINFGNHTHHHAILTNLDDDAVKHEVAECSRLLGEWTGSTINALAYPNGRHNDRVRQLVGATGIEAAFTTQPELLPLKIPQNKLQIGRWLHEPFGAGKYE